MLFNSLIFLIFLPIVMAAFHVPAHWRVRKIILLLLSYLFYAAWYPPHLLILWGSTIVNWVIARRMTHSATLHRKRQLLGIALATNLGILGTFKYSAFLVRNLDHALACVRLPVHLPVPQFFLPVGISFFTFEALSYIIDVYRGRMGPANSLVDFALFLAFFPRMVAGPIMRAANFLPQCAIPSRLNWDAIGDGLALLTIGIFEKAVLADALFAPVAALEIQIATIRQVAGKIRARGGGVLFFRMISSTPVREVERARFPDPAYWEVFRAKVGFPCLSYQDIAGLDQFICPEGAHLDKTEAPAFTAILGNYLVRQKVLPP